MHFILLILLVLFSPYVALSEHMKVSEVIEACEKSGGEWDVFFDACADTCYAERADTPICTKAPKKSCECGPAKCWDTGTIACVDN